MSDEPLTEFDMKHLADKLLLPEYPDHMAAMSCSCEPEAVCGAHRLFALYGQLFDQLQATNKDRAALRAERDTLTAQLAEFAEIAGLMYCVTHDEIIDERNDDECRASDEPGPCRGRDLFWKGEETK